MENGELPVFTLIADGKHLLQTISSDASEDNEEEGVIYLTIKDDESENEESLPLVVQDESLFDPSMVLNSGVKIVTVDDCEQLFYISNNQDLVSTEKSKLMLTDEDDDSQTQVKDAVREDTLFEWNTNLEAIESEDPAMNIVKVSDEETTVPSDKNNKKFKCLYKGCEKFYSSSQHLTVHMRNHVNSKPFPCTFEGCDKKFATNYSLTAHFRTHTGEKPFYCRLCPKSFKTSGDLMKHVRIHTGEKPFLCPVEGCGKSFTTSNIRKVHIRSHTGERPYICDYPNCNKAFASSTNYKNHARIHSGEKPYMCSVEGCDKKFTEYSSLYKHQAVHRIEKPHECNYCKQKLKSEHTLNVHKKVKHGVLVSAEGVQFLDMESVKF